MNTEKIIRKFMDEFSTRLTSETMENYQRSLRQFFAFCEKPFDEIERRDIRSWLIHLEKKSYKPSTMNLKLFAVKLFYKYCVEEGFLAIDPAESIPHRQLEEALPRYLEQEQLMQLRGLVENQTRERAIIEVLYTTGIRLKELIEMKNEDIVWSERMIYIRNGKGKKERIVLFTRQCEEWLRKYLESRSDDLPFVFVTQDGTRPLGRRVIQLNFESYREPLNVHLTVHMLRHTFAAHLAIKGMPLACIQVLLGHDSPHQTQLYARLYSHARKQQYDEWM